MSERFTPDGWVSPSEDARALVGLAKSCAVVFYSGGGDSNANEWLRWVDAAGIHLAGDMAPPPTDAPKVVIDTRHTPQVRQDQQLRRTTGHQLWDILIPVYANGIERGCLVTFHITVNHKTLLFCAPALVP